MQTDPINLLKDVDDAANQIQSFIKGIDLDDYDDDFKTQSAVERMFINIGEALNILNRYHPGICSNIPKFRQIIDFRNLLVHGYASVKPNRVWRFAKNELPELHSVVKGLLDELNGSKQ